MLWFCQRKKIIIENKIEDQIENKTVFHSESQQSRIKRWLIKATPAFVVCVWISSSNNILRIVGQANIYAGIWLPSSHSYLPHKCVSVSSKKNLESQNTNCYIDFVHELWYEPVSQATILNYRLLTVFFIENKLFVAIFSVSRKNIDDCSYFEKKKQKNIQSNRHVHCPSRKMQVNHCQID